SSFTPRSASAPLIPYTTLFRSIRTLNGRVEVLENQISTLVQEKENGENSEDSQKITLLQEAMAKMELQIQKLEHELLGSSQNVRSEEHTSELQSRENLVCRLLL